MPSSKKQLPLAGSDRSSMPGAREVGPADPGEMVEVTVRLRSRGGPQPIFNPEIASQLPSQRPIMSREEFEKTHGADPASIARVEQFAHDHRLKVVETSAARRTVVLSGDVAAMSAAFGVELKEYEHPGGKYRGRTGAVHIPSDLLDVIEGVFGLDNRPQAKPHFRRRRNQPAVHAHRKWRLCTIFLPDLTAPARSSR